MNRIYNKNDLIAFALSNEFPTTDPQWIHYLSSKISNKGLLINRIHQNVKNKSIETRQQAIEEVKQLFESSGGQDLTATLKSVFVQRYGDKNSLFGNFLSVLNDKQLRQAESVLLDRQVGLRERLDAIAPTTNKRALNPQQEWNELIGDTTYEPKISPTTYKSQYVDRLEYSDGTGAFIVGKTPQSEVLGEVGAEVWVDIDLMDPLELTPILENAAAVRATVNNVMTWGQKLFGHSNKVFNGVQSVVNTVDAAYQELLQLYTMACRQLVSLLGEGVQLLRPLIDPAINLGIRMGQAFQELPIVQTMQTALSNALGLSSSADLTLNSAIAAAASKVGIQTSAEAVGAGIAAVSEGVGEAVALSNPLLAAAGAVMLLAQLYPYTEECPVSRTDLQNYSQANRDKLLEMNTYISTEMVAFANKHSLSLTDLYSDVYKLQTLNPVAKAFDTAGEFFQGYTLADAQTQEEKYPQRFLFNKLRNEVAKNYTGVVWYQDDFFAAGNYAYQYQLYTYAQGGLYEALKKANTADPYITTDWNHWNQTTVLYGISDTWFQQRRRQQITDYLKTQTGDNPDDPSQSNYDYVVEESGNNAAYLDNLLSAKWVNRSQTFFQADITEIQDNAKAADAKASDAAFAERAKPTGFLNSTMNSALNYTTKHPYDERTLDPTETAAAFAMAMACYTDRLGAAQRMFPYGNFRHVQLRRVTSNLSQLQAIFYDFKHLSAHTLYIAIKGQRFENFMNGKMEIDAKLVSMPGTAIGVRVHQEFLTAAEELADQVLVELKRLGKSYSADIIFTGHSLGGSVALLIALHPRLQETFRHITRVQTSRPRVYGFGMPRVGNSAFVKWVNDQKTLSIVRVTNDNDPVARTPLMRNGYRHVGLERLLDKGGRYANIHGDLGIFEQQWQTSKLLTPFAKMRFRTMVNTTEAYERRIGDFALYYAGLQRELEQPESAPETVNAQIALALHQYHGANAMDEAQKYSLDVTQHAATLSNKDVTLEAFFL